MKPAGPFLFLPLCMLAAIPISAAGQTTPGGAVESAGPGTRFKAVRKLDDYRALNGFINEQFAKPEAQLEIAFALEAAGLSRRPGDPVRRAMVGDLTRLLDGTTDVVRASVIARLPYSFVESDFDQAAAGRVMHEYKAGPPSKATILSAGMAAFDRIKPELAKLAAGELKEPSAGRYYGTPEWAALLVLARNGDKPCMERILAAARGEQDVVVRTTVLVKDIQLVPSREIVEFLVEMAQSDERLPQVKATAPGTPVADRAIQALSTMLENPPELRDPSAPSSEERQAFRAWLSKPSHLKIKPVSAK